MEEHLNGVLHLAALLAEEGEEPATLYVETHVEPTEALKQAAGIGEGRAELLRCDPTRFHNHICFYHKLATKLKLHPLARFIEARMRSHYNFDAEKCPRPELRESVFDARYLDAVVKEQ